MRRRFAMLTVPFLLLASTPAQAGHPALGAIEGVVTAQDTSSPLGGVCIVAYGDDDYGWAESSPDGSYSIGVTPGIYRVFFDAGCIEEYLSEWFDDAPSYSEATDIHVQAGEPANASAALSRGGSIEGTLTSEDGGPAPTCVSGYNADGDWMSYTYADDDGTYRLPRLSGLTVVQFGCAAGPVSYELVASPQRPVASADSGPPAGSGYGFVGEYFDDVSSFSAATRIDVPPGATVSGIDAVLSPAGAIAGSITDEAGRSLDDICVDVYRPNGEWAASGYSWEGWFEVAGLASGDYRVGFSDCGWPERYSSEYFDDASSFASASDVAVVAPLATRIDAALAALPRPDAAITSLSVTPVPLRTDAISAPGPGTQREVHARAENLGEATTDMLLTIWAQTRSDGVVTVLKRESFSDLVPGEQVDRTVHWNATRNLGDVDIFALACAQDDSNRLNDERTVSSYGVVGGTGVGASVPGTSFGDRPYCGWDY